MRKESVANWNELQDRKPAYALLSNVDLVVIRYDQDISVLYGRCLHRGALLADGHIQGPDLICGVHQWDYRYDTGVSAYNNEEGLHKFQAWVDDGQVWVDGEEIEAWEKKNPQPYRRDEYQGLYADPHGSQEEPYAGYIQQLARDGLSKTGPPWSGGGHGGSQTTTAPVGRHSVVVAQLARLPLLDEEPVGTEVVIGPASGKPLAWRSPCWSRT